MVTAGESVCDLRISLSEWLECCCLEEHLTKGKYKSIAWCAVCSPGHIMVLVTETLILFSFIVIRIQLRAFLPISAMFYLNENCHHLVIMQNDRTNSSG